MVTKLTARRRGTGDHTHFPRRPAARFLQAEDGSILVFGIIFFVAVIIVVGISLDVIHYERERTQAQNTLDRAVLAAADISQTADAQDVFDDYFAKAGLSHLTPVADSDGDEFETWKTVTGTLQLTQPTWFMHMVGIDNLSGPVDSAAEERIGNVEISLVLDVSGSMGWNATDPDGTVVGTKISLLHTAASDFVDTMFTNVVGDNSEPGRLSITVVPYAQQVVLGSALAGRFTLSSEHSDAKGTCVDFYADDFLTTAVDPTVELKRTARADLRNSNQSPANLSTYECPQGQSSREVLAFSDDQEALTSMIENLSAQGDTAIDIGAKWGLAFLDPSTRPVLDDMIDNDVADASLDGRPFDYDEGSALKVMVLMTDGENTNTYAVKEPYRSGASPMYKSSAGKYYYYLDRSSTTSDYYYYDAACPTTKSGKNGCTSTSGWKTASSIGTMTNVTYPTLWETFSLSWYGSRYVQNATGNSNFYNDAVLHTSYGGKDDLLESVCNAAKAQGVLVFTIGFEAPTEGETVMKKCATADSYYYDAQGTTISEAFAGIANAITMLRLTQ